MMKCPHCEAEVLEGKVCARCGKEIAALKGIEVQYRDFKISEMLDIRIPTQASSREGSEEAATVQSQTEVKQKQPGEKRTSNQSRSVTFLIAVIIILFAAAAWFLLFKFLFKF